MATSIGARLRHALWNAFNPEDQTAELVSIPRGVVTSVRPDRNRSLPRNSEKTIIAAIYTRLAIDVAAVRIEHVRTNDQGQYVETIYSGLNSCLNVEANLDQAGRNFRQDMALSLFGTGVIAIVPVDTTINPNLSGSWDVKTMRVGEVIDWYPQQVKVRLYNDRTGQRQDIILPKSTVGIVENPFYSVMNEHNSTLQRLIHKLSLLDNVDEIASQGKLDIIIQLPYVIKSDTRRQQAERRTKDIQAQLKDSTYGIAYTDGTEHITQLNRSITNNLLEQIQYLKAELYNELGLTENIMNGTADDVEMLNYTNRFIEPVVDAITEEIARKFLTKTARSQLQTIMYFQTPFKLLPISELANVADVLSRNQIVTPNEFRPVLGLKPSKQPQADQLVNSNMPLSDQITGGDGSGGSGDNSNASADPQADAAEANLDSQMAELGIS